MKKFFSKLHSQIGITKIYFNKKISMKKNLPESHFLPIDEEEMELMNLVEKWEIKISPKNSLAKSVLESIKKDSEKTSVSLRINSHSLDVIKKFSKKSGVWYQTFLLKYIDQIADEIETSEKILSYK